MAAKGLNSVFLVKNPSSASVLFNAIEDKIVSLFGWTKGEGDSLNTVTSNIDTSLSIVFNSSEKTMTVHSKGTDGLENDLKSVEFVASSTKTFFFNYIISKNKRSYAFGISTEEGSAAFSILIAGDITAIGNDTKYRQAAFYMKPIITTSSDDTPDERDDNLYIFDGRTLTFEDITGTCYSMFPFDGDDVSSSLTRLPNVYNGCFFEDVYCIASTPLNQQAIQTGSFYIDGKYYKGLSHGAVSSGGGVGFFAMLL